MQNVKISLFFCLLFSITLIESFCHIESNDLTINLQYFKENPIDSEQSILTGLKWVFSYLGASLESESARKGIQFQADNIVAIDIEKLGFNSAALNVWNKLILEMKKSEEYQKNQHIDIGRFVMLTFNSSNHYYALTQVQPSLKEFRATYEMTKKPFVFHENESGVAKGNRIVHSALPDKAMNEIGYLAIEGSGSKRKKTFKATDYEVFSFMENGQPRFAIYNETGKLKTSVPKKLGAAGKPAKCMWCHESNIQPSFKAIPEKPHLQKFTKIMTKRRKKMHEEQLTIATDLDYAALQDHSMAELLYLLFMEPSATRLAHEWNLSLKATKAKLRKEHAHEIEEFKQWDFGPRYHREKITKYSPYKVIRVSENARDYAKYEPDFLNDVVDYVP